VSRARDLSLNLLIAGASVLIGLAALEGAARATRSGPKGGKEQGERILYAEYDPVLGWHKRPGAHVVYDRRDYTVAVSINSRGLRDKEREYAPAPGAFRVLAVGDSFVEAFMVPFEDTVAQRLEASLSGSPCPVEVINGGTSGYSTDQEYLFYREEGVRYAPKVVVLFFYYNDVLYNAMDMNIHIPKPLLSFETGRPVVVNLPVPRQTPPAAQKPQTMKVRGSAALEWLAERLEVSAPRAYNAIARTGIWQPTRRLPVSPEFRVYRSKLPGEIKDAWDMTGSILTALDREALGHGARLLVAYIPSRMEVNDADWELTRIRYGLKEGKWDRGKVVKRLGQICKAEKIPLLDLSPALRRAGDAFYETDSHWNARGQLAAAQEIAGFLKSQGWVDCSSR
jgi:hypothetical protein